jgi:hypothetical protein
VPVVGTVEQPRLAHAGQQLGLVRVVLDRGAHAETARDLSLGADRCVMHRLEVEAVGRQPRPRDRRQVIGAGGDADDPPPCVAQGGHSVARTIVGQGFLVETGIAERLVEKGNERCLGKAEVEEAQVVALPGRRMRGDAEPVGDASGDGRAEVAQDTVEIETTEHNVRLPRGYDTNLLTAGAPGQMIPLHRFAGAPEGSASGHSPVGVVRNGSGTAPRRLDGIRRMATRGRSASDAGDHPRSCHTPSLRSNTWSQTGCSTDSTRPSGGP